MNSQSLIFNDDKCIVIRKKNYICALMNSKLEIELESLSQFQPITLSEMDEVKLMNRTDTKFVFPRTILVKVLKILSESYRVLEIKGNRISSYQTLYFDTDDFQFYLDHHNGKGDRFKVRIRNYVESDLFFLEIKNKYKGRTDKKRIKLKGFEDEFSSDSEKFVKGIVGDDVNLKAKLWNSFSRITLVNQAEKERLTLDLNLGFSWENTEANFSSIIIGELKQENVNRNSLFYTLMKNNGISPNSISKYCIGAISLNPDLKYNNFKSKTLLLEKLQNYDQ